MNMPATQLSTLSANLAKKLDLGIDGQDLIQTLKQTAFKGDVSDSQMSALLIVAGQYGLNPRTKEIYAYPDKQNGIVPVVGVDGWSRIINEHPQYNGVEFSYSPETLTHKGKVAHEWIECTIFRKDREKPTVIREYFDEVCRTVNFPTPWDSHPKRMHRHKTLIQCSRVAFGFSGIYDEDEAERIVEKEINPAQQTEQVKREPASLPPMDEAKFLQNFPSYEAGIKSGRKTADQVITTIQSKFTLTADQENAIRSVAAPIEGEAEVVE